MNKFSCLIIEDTDEDAQFLRDTLVALSIFQQIDVSNTATSALSRLATIHYDLIFLDMQMPDQLGIDFLRETQNRPPVIVVSANVSYALPCYDLEIADFLSKPFEPSRLLRSIKRAFNKTPTAVKKISQNIIFLQANRQTIPFRFKDICFVEAHRDYTKIHSPQTVTIVSHTISWIEMQLPADTFMRIQKSFIVNLNWITAIESRSVWVNKIKLSVGTQYADKVRQFIQGDH